MKNRIYRFLGKFLIKLTTLRNLAWEKALRKRFASIHPTSSLEYPLKVVNPGRIHIGRGSRISWCGCLSALTESNGQKFDPEIVIGDDCYIGNHVQIVAARKIVIGNNVMVADRVCLSDMYSGYHNADPPNMKSGRICGGEVHIGEDSWIGENASIIGNIRIGRHCVVGANAVVTGDIPSFSVAVGVPARVIKRYNFASKAWEATHDDGRFLDAPQADPSSFQEVGHHLPQAGPQV